MEIQRVAVPVLSKVHKLPLLPVQ